MNTHLATLWTLLCPALAMELCLVTSASTPAEFFSVFFERFHQRLSADQVYLQEVEGKTSSMNVQNCTLVLDASADSHVTTELELLAREDSLTIMRMSPNSKIAHRLSLDVHPEPYEVVPYLDAALQFFDWTSVSLFYSPNDFGTIVKHYFSDRYQFTDAVINNEETEENIQKILRKEVKSKGASIGVIATSLSVVEKLLSVLQSEKMMATGFAYIMAGEAVWEEGLPTRGQPWPFLLQLREKDCVLSRTLFECDADRVASIITRASATLRTPARNLLAGDFTNYFTQCHLCIASEFVLVNTGVETNSVVGSFPDGRTMQKSGDIRFPGNVTVIPKLSFGVVKIGINSGILNPTLPPLYAVASFYLGESFAVKHINEHNGVLLKPTLVSNNVSFGASQWVESWAVPRILASRDRLGVAFLTGYASSVVRGTLLAFDKYNLSRPVVGSGNSLMSLGNSTAFPWFLRNSISDLYFAAMYTNIAPVLGWKRCAVLYGDDEWGVSVYSQFKRLADAKNIEILNNETLRKMPGLGVKKVYWEQCREHLLELFRCNARYVILFLLQPVPQYILQLMFDLGARKGDFIFTGQWLSMSYLTQGSAVDLAKQKEVLEGTVGFSMSAWIGPFGQGLKKAFEAEYNLADSSPYSCLYYDSTFVVAHALETCTELGLNYEDPHVLMKVLRETRFMGCTGFISWNSGENNRAEVVYSILNLVRDEGNYALNIVGSYNPTSTVVFNFSMPLRFADGSATPPSDLRVVLKDCPFEERYLHPFTQGRNVVVGVCATFAGLSATFAGWVLKREWRIKVPAIERSEISVADVVFMTTIGVEAVQLASMGPDFRNLNSIIMTLSQMVTVDLSDVATLSKGVYWISLDVTLGLVGAWVFLNLFSLCRLETRLRGLPGVNTVQKLADLALPLLGNVCFVPIVFILLDVFICDHAVGSGHLEYTGSVLFRDCYVSCWQGTHITYVSLASVSLLVYVPSAMLLRPLWDEGQDTLHIKTVPTFTVAKSLVQIFLLCLSKTAKRWNQLESGVTFLCVVGAFFAFTCKYRAYNYSRANLWQSLSLLGVLVLSTTAIIDTNVYSYSSFRLVIVVLIVWLLITRKCHSVSGLLIQSRYLPSMLYKKPGRDFNKIVKFAFTNTVQAKEIQPTLNYARKDATNTSFAQTDNSQTIRR